MNLLGFAGGYEFTVTYTYPPDLAITTVAVQAGGSSWEW